MQTGIAYTVKKIIFFYKKKKGSFVFRYALGDKKEKIFFLCSLTRCVFFIFFQNLSPLPGVGQGAPASTLHPAQRGFAAFDPHNAIRNATTTNFAAQNFRLLSNRNNDLQFVLANFNPSVFIK